MKKRFFTFGCSFTTYSWPTWATLLSTSEYDLKQNWGLAGLGNRAIAERIAECNVKYKFTENDVVIVQWSTHLRNDFFHQDGLIDALPGWKTRGSLFNLENRKLYDETWLKTFFDEEAYIYHTLNHIHMTQQLLENSGCKWYMTSIGDIRNLCQDFQVGVNYGEKSIFSKLNDLFSKKEFPLYVKTPSLKVYDDVIWNKHKDKWLDPILSFLQKESNEESEIFFSFYDETVQQMFLDYHPKTSAFYYWIDKIVREKTDLDIDDKKCSEMSDKVDEIYLKLRGRKDPFERIMHRERFYDSTWPEDIIGYMTF